MKLRKTIFLLVSFMLLLALMSGQTKRSKLDPDFSAFWIKFKAAVARNDKAAVADMTKLPFMIESQDVDRAGFLRHYRSLFTPSVRRCFARERPMKEQGVYEIFCGEEIFLFAKVNGVYKFTEIGVND